MEYKLIANSGIQLLTVDLEIDMNVNTKQLYHEWFDEMEVQTNLELAYQLPESLKVVRLAELQSCNFVDTANKLTVSEQEILANPNIEILYEGDVENSEEFFTLRLNDERRCKLSKMYDQWLPLPYFEINTIGNLKHGPFNWVRCKMVRCGEETTKGVIPVTMIIAVDTRCIYDEPDMYEECPSFVSDSEKEKHFRITDNALSMLDFCSGKNSWIRSYLMKMVHGVTELEDIKVVTNEHRFTFLATYMLIIDYLSRLDVMPQICITRDRDVTTKGVEMIVDIGNSRTSAILFEEGDFTKVKPLRLQNFSNLLTYDGKLNRTQDSFDMRIAFQKVSFGDKTISGSSQFVWPSIVRLGQEAEMLTHQTINFAEGDEILSTYSSPKRYLWDDKATKEEWRCVRTDEERNEEPIIEGISNYFNDDGSIEEDGFGVGLHYSRKTLMTLAFIEIISQAEVQINSYEHREFHGNISTPRRLSKVILTCPTAMSKREQIALHDSLKNALWVLEKFSTNIDPSNIQLPVQIVPQLSRNEENPQWIFDEATCSQFVYLYGLFSGTYLNNSKEFFSIYGKERMTESIEKKPTLRVGSLDIGAGTSDIMICQYEYNAINPSRLKPIPIFWDSFDFAGDDMMKVLIENVIIQGKNGIIEQELAKRGMEDVDIYRKLYQFFGADNNALSFRDRTLRRDFNVQVCVPVMNYFLDLLGHDKTYREISYEELFANIQPSEAVREQFQKHFGFPLREIRWVYDAEILSTNIRATMDKMLQTVSTIAYEQDCDIFILSGRPTSLKPIHDTFLKYFAVSPNRLIVLNKHRVGRWYPFADEFGYLSNSKSVVPVGAMIGYLASTAAGMNHFSLDLSELGKNLLPTTEYFTLKDNTATFNKSFITPEDNSGKLMLTNFPSYIGCRQFDFPGYHVRPFYVLDVNSQEIIGKIEEQLRKTLSDGEKQRHLEVYCEKMLSKVPVTFLIERENYQEDKETLVISSINGADGEDIPIRDFALSIQSLNDPECYWLDSGAFNINIKANI